MEWLKKLVGIRSAPAADANPGTERNVVGAEAV